MPEVHTPGDAVSEHLANSGIDVVRVEERTFPGELFVIVSVAPEDVRRASEETYAFDDFDDENVLITVRAADPEERSKANKAPVKGVSDLRVDEMQRLISSHSRSSLAQPSLQYIQDGPANLSRLVSSRHCLIYGRRGAGKTSLLVEGRRAIESQGGVPIWLNMQPYRGYTAGAMVAAFARLVLEELAQTMEEITRGPATQSHGVASRLAETLDRVRDINDVEADSPAWLPVEVNNRLREFSAATGKRVVVFIDDFYLFPPKVQPFILEGMHGCTRDTDTWLKVASVKHLTRAWDSESQSGLESPHDVEAIDLDVTLQEPEAATSFLIKILESYSIRASIPSLQSVFHRRALDRLVFASGAVPRDYLVLANRSIAEARRRSNARVVGVEDVNRAAGRASAEKRRELEEDLAAQSSEAAVTLEALSALRNFCLDRADAELWTYFRVSFNAKESRQEEYALLTRLLEVRMVHMLDSSISDPKRAGIRFEVYMLDLSEYSGQRLRRGVHVLNFEGGRLTAQKTGEPKSRREGKAARDVTGIFRRAPELELAVLAG
jgi:hypothetical protein